MPLLELKTPRSLLLCTLTKLESLSVSITVYRKNKCLWEALRPEPLYAYKGKCLEVSLLLGPLDYTKNSGFFPRTMPTTGSWSDLQNQLLRS